MITTNLKSINNQKHQKIKLHGTPTTKKLKKKINQTGKAVDCARELEKTAVRQQNGRARLAEGKTGSQS